MHVGNDADGPNARAYHASSLAMSELMHHVWEWNSNDDDDAHNEDNDNNNDRGKTTTSTPMLAVVVVVPVLAQGGRHYAARIDKLLHPTVSWTTSNASSSPSNAYTLSPSLLRMARDAVSYCDAILHGENSHIADHTSSPSPSSGKAAPSRHLLTPRERWHLHAMYQLLHNNHQNARGIPTSTGAISRQFAGIEFGIERGILVGGF